MEVKRTEQKFILTHQESMLLRSRLEAIVPRDRHCDGLLGYDVRSLYFDTVGDRCCAEKEDGLRDHEKIRIRIYGTDTDIIKLESKQKRGDAQFKQSLSISRQLCDALCRGQYQGLLELQDPLALYFYRKLSEGMMPKVIIQYRRVSYCLPTNSTRITFDYRVRATESSFDLFRPQLNTHPILPEELVILEVKYNNFLLSYIKQALRTMARSTSSFSKYFSGRSFYRHYL